MVCSSSTISLQPLTLPPVWIVSNEQLLDWVQNPVPVSQLDQVQSLKCSTPQVSATQQICNGIPQNENGLLDKCNFPDFPFFTCVSLSFGFVGCRCVTEMDGSMDARLKRLRPVT